MQLCAQAKAAASCGLRALRLPLNTRDQILQLPILEMAALQLCACGSRLRDLNGRELRFLRSEALLTMARLATSNAEHEL